MPLEERLARSLVATPPPIEVDRLGRSIVGPCAIWTGALDSDGYGVIFDTDRRTNRKVHRLAYELAVGEITDQLDHLCRVRNCAAPTHLEDVPGVVNTARGDLGERERSKVECVNGHAFDEVNTYVDKVGARHCRVCDRDRHRAAHSVTPLRSSSAGRK